MPARIAIGIWAFVMAFFGLNKRDKKNPEELIVDSFNQSYDSWVAKGWVPPR
jgi:hypothetical protein